VQPGDSPTLRADTGAAEALTVPPGAGLAAVTVALYAQVAAVTDPAAVEAMLDAAAARPRSLERDVEIEALLARLTELDFARAARAGESLLLDMRLLTPIFRERAAVDLEGALDALAV